MGHYYGSTGLKLGPAMEEAMQRMEAGEDPDHIEKELGDQLEAEDPFATQGKRAKLKDMRKKILPPTIDETLYDL